VSNDSEYQKQLAMQQEEEKLAQKQFMFESSSESGDDIMNYEINLGGQSKAAGAGSRLESKMRTKMKKEKLELPGLMWRHDSSFRMKWDLFVMSLALYNCIMIPYNVAFQVQSTGEESTGASIEAIVDRVIDVLFLTDVILNFRTTYINAKTNLEVVNAQRIACNYVSS
jgi:hypothetical protein